MTPLQNYIVIAMAIVCLIAWLLSKRKPPDDTP
jgi:lipopolysaccharide export system protein LptC